MGGVSGLFKKNKIDVIEGFGAVTAGGNVLVGSAKDGVEYEALRHPLTPDGVRDALERVKMIPAASGSPGTYISFGNWMHRGWVGAGYLVARRLDPDGVTAHHVARFGGN